VEQPVICCTVGNLYISPEITEFRRILERLAKEGWAGAIAESERAFLSVAGGLRGIPDLRLSAAPDQRFPRHPRNARRAIGDVYFRDAAIFYCALYLPRVVLTASGRELQAADFEPFIQIGCISSGANEPASQSFEALQELVTRAVSQCVDGRRLRHRTLEWAQPRVSSSRLSELTKSDASSDLRFEQAQLAAEEVNGAEDLAIALAREVLQDLSQAGFRLERDILGKRQRKAAEVHDAIAGLKKTGLIQPEYLVQCRRTNAPLTRIASVNELQTALGALSCPNCNSRFSDEITNEGWTLTELGKRLGRKSHWMTIWITKRLVEAGVPLDSILWGVTESSEELDIVAECFNELWIFELKDREFGGGDAHPFHYRRMLFEADRSFVITTSTISPDARRIFKDLSEQSSVAEDSVIYVEGLDRVAETFRKHVDTLSMDRGAEQLEELGAYSGLNLKSVLKRFFDQSHASAARG
jgi:hypothetical protein